LVIVTTDTKADVVVAVVQHRLRNVRRDDDDDDDAIGGGNCDDDDGDGTFHASTVDMLINNNDGTATSSNKIRTKYIVFAVILVVTIAVDDIFISIAVVGRVHLVRLCKSSTSSERLC
jgi:hypothetical protein